MTTPTTRRVVNRRATTPRTPTATGIFGKVRQHLVFKSESEVLKRRYEVLRDDIMKYLDENGEKDEKGHKSLDLPTPISVAGKEFTSIKRERRVSTSFDEAAAEELLNTKKGLLARVQRTTLTITSSMVVNDAFQVTGDGRVILWRDDLVKDAVLSWSKGIDQNEIYVLNQEGLITDKELDSLFVENESFAYKPLAT
jgi:hypothetical protein